MQISYIWIEKFRSLENLNFNFSNDFEFFYDPESNTLHQTPKSDISLNNFYGDKIINLNAIIGENGVGKTSVFNCIQTIYNDLKESFSEKSNARKVSKLNYIVVLKIDNKYQYFANILSHNPKTDLAVFQNRGNQLEDLFLVYYTNFFDYSSQDKSDHTFDLSTNSLVNYLFETLANKAEEDENYSLPGNFHYVYKTREIVSQIEFISAFDQHVPFPIPSELSIAIRYEVPKAAYLHGEGKVMYEKRLIDEPEERPTKDEANYFKAIDVITKILLRLEKEVSEKPSGFKRLVQQAILINFFEDVVFEKNIVVDLHLLGFDVSKLITNQKISKTRNLDELFVYTIEKVSGYRKIKLNARELLRWIDEFVVLIVENGEFISEKSQLNIDLSKINLQKFKKHVRELEQFPFSPFLDFFWEGISSGENALITIFSRIYGLRHNLNKETATVIYMLDECEINFHPEWQRKFVKLLSTLLQEMFPLCKHQIIISSHSPLMLSDIPKSNVVFLEKKDSKVFVSHLSERKQTFAANIHTLLSDAFFMKEGTIGEVAKEKINWVIDQLNSRYSVFEQNLDEIKRIVDLIGEPVIRTKLANMIDEKLKINIHNIDSRLKDLESKKNR